MNRSLILIEEPKGKLKGVYCHSDGESVGNILVNYYATRDRVEELLSFGDIFSLKRNIYGNDNDSCEFYARDRGEEKHEIKKFKNRGEIITKHQFQEYNYIFGLDGKWKYFENNKFQEIKRYE